MPLSDARCPRCHQSLSPIDGPRMVAHACASCGGLWVDNAGCQALLREADPRVTELARRAREAARQIVHEDGKALACPSCQKQLERFRVPDVGCLVDVCREHGTWFDAGEVELITHKARNRKASPPEPYAPSTVPSAPASDFASKAADVAGDVAIAVAGGVAEVAIETAIEVAIGAVFSIFD